MFIKPFTSPGEVVSVFTSPYLSAGAPALGEAKGLNDYYDILKKQAIQEDFSPHILYKEIFNEYCELFYNNDLNKIEQVIDLTYFIK